jgi:hypothetical protein
MAAASKSQYYSAFDPRIIEDCQLWLDAADRSTLTLSGSNVLTWKDKSGKGYDASAVGTPTFVSNKLNGYGGIFFSTTNGWMIGNASNTGTSLTAFVVADMSLNAMNDARILSLGTVGSQDFDSALRTSCIIRTASSNRIRSFRNNVSLDSKLITYNTPFVATSRFSGSSHSFILNGLEPLSVPSSTGNFGYSNYGLGKDPGLVTTGRHVGHIYEVILYNRGLTDYNRESVEGYLAWKWGIAGPTINPMDIPNIALWLDAADQPSITLSGSNVTQWNDKSGRGCNATQVTVERQPTYDSIGKCLNFVFSSSQYLNLPDSTLPAGNNSYAYFIVASSGTNSGNLGIIGGGDYGTTDGIFGFATSFRSFRTYWDATDVIAPSVGTIATIGSNALFESTYTSGGSRFLYMNGVQWASDTPITPRNQGISNNTLGLIDIPIGAYFNGSIREVIVYSNALTTSDRGKVEAYLATKWRIDNSGGPIPSSLIHRHPYGLEPVLQRPYMPGDAAGVASTIGACQIWVDAADATTIDVCQTTLTVQAIRPKGVFGNSRTTCNLSNASGFSWNQNVFNGNYPAFYQGGSARTASRLGVNTDVSLAQPLTIHFVCDKINVDNGNGYIMDSTNSAARVGIYNHNLALFAGLGIGQTADTSLTVPSIAGAIVSNTTSQTYYNGILRASGSTSNQALRGLTMANRFSLDSGWDGHLSEFMIHSGVLPTFDRQRIEGYLAWKWGLRDNLSPSHPYYLYPPMTVKFNPRESPGCIQWLDAADPLTVNTSFTSSEVAVWLDKSGFSNHVSNLNVGVRPLYVSNHSMPYVSFNGTNQFLSNVASLVATGDRHSIFVVEQRTSSKTSNFFIGGSTTTATSNFGIGYLNDSNMNYQFAGVQSLTSVPTYASDSNIRVWSFIKIDARQTTENGVLRTTTPLSTDISSWTNPYLGRYVNSYYAGRIYEIICYRQFISSNDRMRIEAYLAHKWGRDGSFNAVHPYRTVTP